MKKVIAAILALMLIMCGAASAEVTELSGLKVYVNNFLLRLMDAAGTDLAPVEIDGVMYLPIEAFVQAIGGEYVYDAESEKIIITLSDNTAPDITPEPTAEPRVDITKDNFRDYFNIEIEVSNVKEKTTKGGGWAVTKVTLDVTLTCYPKVPCQTYNVKFKIKTDFKDWVSDNCDIDNVTYNVSLPPDGRYSKTVDIEGNYVGYGLYLNEDSAWFNFSYWDGILESASGYIILE